MTFRFPYQIFRAVSISKTASPDKLFKELKGSNLSSFVLANNGKPILQCSCPNRIKQNITPSFFLPRYSIHRFRTFRTATFEPQKNLDNRKRVRKQHKCFERKCKRKLAFRQATKEECEQCVGTPMPDKCPKLRRLKPAYDETQLKWKHENCPVDLCLETPRSDVLKGLKTTRKKLPKLVNSCQRCAQYVPTKAPKLVRPKKQYDPSKLEQDRNCSEDLCNIDPPRMDDVRGYAVKQKELPKLKALCKQCTQYVPTKAPKLVGPKQHYDPHKMEQNRNCAKDLCNIDPPRMDDVVGLTVESKKLPKLSDKNCVQCIQHVPKYAPKLIRPKRKYDPNKMKWIHPPCKDFCDDAAPRMDTVRGVKIEKKTLPKLKVNKCKRCIYVPKSAPKLIRPTKLYNDKKLKWNHECPPVGCDAHPPRSDTVRGITTPSKKLPKLTPFQECTYCRDTVPTIAPELVPPPKTYDDSKMKWQHVCPPVGCDAHPPRSDDVNGYQVETKKLKKLVSLNECKLCSDVLRLPSKAPKLCGPKQLYDPNKLEQDRNCAKDLCNIDPPRMDDVVGLKTESKVLPKLPEGHCVQCIQHVPKYAPKLIRPKREYDPNEMKWIHPPCKDFCDDASPRMDDVVGLTVTSKKLPKLSAPNKCENCLDYPPKYAPDLKGPTRKYDPSKLEKTHCKNDDLCDLDPPRMDDVLCWKPKKKILPSFKTHCRRFSTLAPADSRKTYPVYSKNYTNIRQYGKKKSKKQHVGTDMLSSIVYPPANCPNTCPKFKSPGCKPMKPRICFQWSNRDCKKKESPYESYGDCMDGWYVDPPSECINWNEVLMQPCKQVSGHFYKLTPPPPKFGHVDPSIERKCVENKCPDPPKIDEPDCWENPCPGFKSCGNRARKYCAGPPDRHKPKLTAPYKSFSEQCPQFPEVELSECDLASKYAYEQQVYYTKKPPKKPEVCKKEKPSFNACKTLPSFMKKRELTKCGFPCGKSKPKQPPCGESKSPCNPNPKIKSGVKSKKSSCCEPEKKSPCGKKKKGKSSKNKKMTAEIDGKKYECKSVALAGPKAVCSTEDNKIKAMVCASKDSIKKYACVCKAVVPCRPKSKEPKSSNTKSDPKKTGSVGTIVCTSKDCKKKMVCVCKPIPSKGNVICPPKKVSPKPKCCPKKPSKSSNSGCCGLQITGMKSQQAVCKNACSYKPLACPITPSQTRQQSNSIWDRICKYFRAREGCPGPNDWKQKELEDKARKAAAAAGLEICRPRCNYIKINKCKKSCPNPCCPQPKKTSCCPKPKKDPSCPKPIPYCPEPKPKSCCPKLKKDPCKPKPKKIPCCPKPKPKKTPCCPKPKKKSCNPCRNEKKTYGTYVAKQRCFSTYSRVHKQMKEKKILTNQNNISADSHSKLSSVRNISHSYLRLNNNYVGRIYKMRFGKIGVKNAMITQNPDEEPFTICHVCKVIPRHEIIYQNNNADIKTLKLKLNSKRERACN